MKIILLLLIPFLLFAQPNPTAYTGDSLTHGNSFDITGASFGSKDPAGPLMWDDCEDRTVDNDASVTGKGWIDVWPYLQASDVDSARTRYRDTGFRTVTSAHTAGGDSIFLSGCHHQFDNNDPQYIGGGQTYRAVCVTADANQAVVSRWFVMWYYRVDPVWPDSGCNAGNIENHKFAVKQVGAGAYAGTNAYDSCREYPCDGDSVMATIGHGSGGCTRLYEGTPPYGIRHYSPQLDWIKYEHRHWSDDTHGRRDWYFNNMYTNGYDGECVNWLDSTRSFTIGGYFRWSDAGSPPVSEMYGDTNAWRYFDDMYVDTVLSRVILGDASTYTACIILEPQICSAWSATSITVTTNLGRLQDSSKAWIYVFNETDQSNSSGLEVDIGQQSQGSSPVYRIKGGGTGEMSGGGTGSLESQFYQRRQDE